MLMKFIEILLALLRLKIQTERKENQEKTRYNFFKLPTTFLLHTFLHEMIVFAVLVNFQFMLIIF